MVVQTITRLTVQPMTDLILCANRKAGNSPVKKYRGGIIGFIDIPLV